ncbi:MAG: hypothetical protein OEM46_05295, partial [Ignavibacteria bacterium]|nr:hypothetical protein [Ignavibacteria bacterium]
YSAEVSVSGMVINPGLGENTYIKTLYGILTGGATVEISVKVLGAASWYLYGQFWMTSLEQAGSHQQTQTFNATFQSDGALSEYTAPP